MFILLNACFNEPGSLRVRHKSKKYFNLIEDWIKKPDINSEQKTSQLIKQNGEENFEFKHFVNYRHLRWSE